MSARPCNTCGKLVLFAKDRDSGRMLTLTNQAMIWRIVPSRNGPPLVLREPKMLSSHYCSQADQPPAAMPEPELHFSEPKDPE